MLKEHSTAIALSQPTNTKEYKAVTILLYCATSTVIGYSQQVTTVV
jgi:hypothetical protein